MRSFMPTELHLLSGGGGGKKLLQCELASPAARRRVRAAFAVSDSMGEMLFSIVTQAIALTAAREVEDHRRIDSPFFIFISCIYVKT